MNDLITKIVKHPASLPAGVGVIAFAAGAGIGYLIGKKRRYEVYQIPEMNFGGSVIEAEDVKEQLSEYVDKVQELGYIVEADVEAEVAATEEAIYGGPGDIPKVIIDATEVVKTEPTIINKTLFAADNDQWNYKDELAKRSRSKPYVLHKDEFFEEGNEDYLQVQYTYYAGDDILTDSDSHPLFNYRNVIGELKFGHGSQDPNVFYVRNDARKLEVEVIYDPGFYSVEIEGLEIENNDRAKNLQHSRVQKFRRDE